MASGGPEMAPPFTFYLIVFIGVLSALESAPVTMSGTDCRAALTAA